MPYTEQTSTKQYVKFDATNTTSNTVPVFQITYRRMTGIENYWSYAIANCGSTSSAAINYCDGELTLSVAGHSTNDDLLPYQPIFYYNGSNKDDPYLLDGTSFCITGCGWKIDSQQRIVEESIVVAYDYDNQEYIEEKYYVWTDADGTQHAFWPYSESSSMIKCNDEDGLGLELVVYPNSTSAKYILREDNSSLARLEFNASGYLIKTYDNVGNARAFVLNSNNRIIASDLIPVGKAAIRQVYFDYNTSNRLTTIRYTRSNRQISFYYSTDPTDTSVSSTGFFLRRIEFQNTSSGTPVADMILSFTYDDNSNLTSITDSLDGVRLSFTYTGNNVTQITEYAITSSGTTVQGQTQRIEYNQGYTISRTSGTDDTIGNSDDLCTRYQFDVWGRSVSSYTTDSTTGTLYGAANTEFVNSQTVKYQNKVKSESSVSRIESSYIQNGTFETISTDSTTPGWTTVSGSLAIVNSTTSTPSYDGNKLAKLTYTSSSSSAIAQAKQSVILPAGTYTASAHVCAGSNISKAYLKIQAGSNTFVSDSVTSDDSLAIQDGYARISVTFTLSSQTTCNVLLTSERADTSIISSYALFDNVALVCGSVSSDASLLYDGNFESQSNAGSNTWDCSSNASIDNFNKWNSKQALKIVGNPNAVHYAKQGVKLMSDADVAAALADYQPSSVITRTYTISGWGRAPSVPLYNPDGNPRAFSIDVTATYLKSDGSYQTIDVCKIPFDARDNDWQFISGVFTVGYKDANGTPLGYPYKITVSCNYDYNCGTAYFDNIVLTPATLATSYAYNDNGRIISAIGTQQDSVTYTYDLTFPHLVKSITYSSGQQISYTYNSHGQVDTITTRVDQYIVSKTTNTYDSYGRLTYTYQAGTGENKEDEEDDVYIDTWYTYSDSDYIFGKLLSEKDTTGAVTTYFWNNSTGNLMAMLQEDGNGCVYLYDAMNRVTNVYPATAYSSTYNYSSTGEKLIYTYDSLNRPSTISTDSTTYTFTYNNLHQTASIKVGNGTIARYIYMPYNGKLKYVVYGNGYVEKYVYDELDRVSEIWYYQISGTIPTSDSTFDGYTYTRKCSYIYDTQGRVWKYKDHIQNETICYDYDVKGNLSRVITYDSSSTVSSVISSFVGTYDDSGKLISAGTGFKIGSNEYTEQLTFQYDSRDMLSAYVYSSTSYSGNISFSYDNLNRLETKNIAIGRRSQIINRYTYLSYENMIGSDSITSASGRVDTVTTTVENSGTSISTSTSKYEYDSLGRIVTIKNDAGTVQVRYRYDELGQLIREDNRAAGRTYIWDFDNAGNITRKRTWNFTLNEDSALGTPTYDYAYTYGNSEWGDQLTKYRSGNCYYDKLGNPTQFYNGRTYKMTWQGRQMKTMTVNGVAASFAYNSDGIRVQKIVAGVTHDYIVDGTTILAEITPDYTLRFIYDESGSPIGFVYTPTGSASATYYYEKNLFGDVIAIWEDTGSSLVKVGTYAFNAYGQNVKVTNLTGGTYTNIASLNPFRYRSYYYDADLYLYHLQSRYFDPVSCRFISADGQLNGGNTILGYNMYAYCGNDPINRTDSTGEVWETVFDVISLGFSIVEVIINPADVSAWISVAGDAIDLIPVVTGVGETIRAGRITNKGIEFVSEGAQAIDNIHDGKKIVDTVDNATTATKKLRRPYIRKSTRQIVESRATRNSLGQFIDPNTGKAIVGKYDLGHEFGHEFWRERERAEALGWNQKQFNDYMNNPDFYRIEDPHANRSHKYEMGKDAIIFIFIYTP